MRNVQTQRTIWLVLLLSGLLIALSACGFTQANGVPSTSPTAPVGESLYVLDGYSSTNIDGQRIIAFHPGNSAFTPLPAGLVSQDHQHIYTATPKNGHTIITLTDTKSGATIRTFTIPGIYSTAGLDYTKSVISSNGRWLVLRQLEQMGNESTFVVIDTQAGKLLKTVQLQGNFDLDAVSPDGSRVYLLQQLGDASGHYYVRLYQVDKQQLYQGIIADKSEINDPRMLGSALTRQMASDGTRAYTLYTDTRSNIAFVHILPLASSFYGARCIDLPTGKSADLLHYYTLALSSDGSTLYATNAALGEVVAINVTDDDAFSDQIITTAHFNPETTQTTNAEKMRTLHNGAVISPDQSILYVAGMNGIVALHLPDLKVTNTYADQHFFTDVALSADGQTLYAVSPNDGITLIDTRSGQIQQIAQSPAHRPWGIEWISG